MVASKDKVKGEMGESEGNLVLYKRRNLKVNGNKSNVIMLGEV